MHASRSFSPSTDDGQDDFVSWCMHQAKHLRERSVNELDVASLAEGLEGIAREQIYALRASYRKLFCDLLNRDQNPELELEIAQQREFIADLLASSPCLYRIRLELFSQAYDDERRKLAAETNIAIANAKFPAEPPFSIDELEARFVRPLGAVMPV
jgi:hypothetical protein